MIVTELTLVAEIRNAVKILSGKLLRIAVNGFRIEPVDQIVERGTEVITAATAVTNVGDALQLRFKLRLIPERFRVEFRCHLLVAVAGPGGPSPDVPVKD